MQHALKQAETPMERILAVSSTLDATQLTLTAAEGYLLSRIDGVTPWRLLRDIGGVPPGEVDSCLTRWIEEGILEVLNGADGDGPADEKAVATNSEPPSEPPAPSVREIDENDLDESLDIDLTVQRRILEFEASLGLPYPELLGVERGADAKIVKRAYFKLSKEFHPDRYFRREIGDYSARLERIFKKVLEAHEILSDPELCNIGNQVAPETPPETPVEAAAPVAADSDAGVEKPSATPKPLTKLERLKQRMPFKINHAAIAERLAKADEIFRAACTSQSAGRYQEAESGIRIAISFDPLRTEFKEALGALRLESAGARAEKLLAAPSERMSDSDLREALTLLEDVLIYRPHDPKLNDRAARVCLQLGKSDAAAEYAQTLIERSPEVAEHHALLGTIYRGQDKLNEAVTAFEKALKYDEENLDARRALAAIRIGHHDAVQGEHS